MIKLKYGNTNTFFIQGNNNGLLIDTDYAGTLPAFYKTIKANQINIETVRKSRTELDKMAKPIKEDISNLKNVVAFLLSISIF